MVDFFEKLIAYFNFFNIPYMLSGSIAMGVYVNPRATRDIDFIVNLRSEDIDDLVNHFNEGYYCSREAVTDAIKRQSMFNIIDHTSGYKSDFVILKDSEYRRTEFERRSNVDYLGLSIFVVSAEDLLLSKLIWIQDYQSPVQIEDIKNLSAIANLERNYINHWIKKLNLNTFNLL